MARRVSKGGSVARFSVQKLLSVICNYFESRNKGVLPFGVVVQAGTPDVHGDLETVMRILFQLLQVLKNETAADQNMKLQIAARRVFGRERENIYGVAPGSYVEFILSAATKRATLESKRTFYASGGGVPIMLRSVSDLIKKQEGAFMALADEKEAAYRFVLPARTRSSERGKANLEKVIDRENCTILVADSDPNILGLVESGLKLKGFSVIARRDGGEALEEFEKNKDEVALLFADTSLPHVDGAALARNANILKPGLRVILTGSGNGSQGEDCVKDIEYSAYISKPYPLPDLFSLIDSLLKG